jgi:hypothetical protein
VRHSAKGAGPPLNRGRQTLEQAVLAALSRLLHLIVDRAALARFAYGGEVDLGHRRSPGRAGKLAGSFCPLNVSGVAFREFLQPPSLPVDPEHCPPPTMLIATWPRAGSGRDHLEGVTPSDPIVRSLEDLPLHLLLLLTSLIRHQSQHRISILSFSSPHTGSPSLAHTDPSLWTGSASMVGTSNAAFSTLLEHLS